MDIKKVLEEHKLWLSGNGETPICETPIISGHNCYIMRCVI